MDDEFALCWNNFQDNIASGFQNLYDRGYLVDVTLACDGKLLQAHKIVLAICSPYFQEMFIANPCKHPIIVLKDISSTVMTELLQFMYQGVVNVKHAELSTFMKIAQTLQIKGLATSSTSKSSNQFVHDQDGNERMSDINEDSPSNNRKNSESKLNLSSMVSQRLESSMTQPSCSSSKRNIDHEHMSMKKHCKRYSDMDAQNLNATSMELSTSDDVALPPVPQISMVESRFDINNVKREISDMPVSPGSMRNSVPSHFNFDYNVYQPRNIEYPNELHAENDFPKSAGNYNDIPAGSNITMLTSTSLLHGNCIFNRNNTVATQQGMKTYWLCKSYRITMCRARCITHQGRIISATGVHNHQPHMKPSGSNDLFNPFINSVHSGMQQSGGNDSNLSNATNAMPGGSNVRMPQNANTSHNLTNQQQQHLPFPSSQQYSSGYHQMHYPPELQGQHNYSSNNAAVLQNMMQNVLSQNNLMHLTNMAPMLNPLSQYSSPASNSSVGLNKMQLAADNYASFSQTSRNNDESQILESQNINTAASMISSPNRGNSGCENFSSSNNNNTVNSNNNSKNPSGNISIKDGGSSENNNNSIKSNNNNSDENIYYSGETGNNNASRSSESISSNTNISSRVSNNNNNDNGNNDPQNHITNDNVNQNNSSKNIANNDSTSSSNNDGSNSSSSNIMSARSSVNSTIVPVCTASAVESNCENVPPIASDLSESNLISISPTQITFKIERT